jgi:serine/threonine protein kinase
LGAQARASEHLAWLFSDPHGPRNHERITNEAKALALVSTRTTLPVPRLLAHGTHPDGRRYLTTEYIPGPTLAEFPHRSCSKPAGQLHIDTTPCSDCSHQAYSNAVDFVSSTVIPQLAALTSRVRGIDGFVMPPAWLSPDVQPPWRGTKKSWATLPLERPEYIFQHGDLSDHNIIVDPQTLEVRAVIDWEYAGFYPPGMENWSGTLGQHAEGGSADDVADLIERFLPAEYLECYDQWSDKVELDDLIKRGQLPHPAQMREHGAEN